MKIKYSPVRWNEYSPHPDNWKAETEIKVIDALTLEVDGELFEFPEDGFTNIPYVRGEPDNSIRAQTGGIIEEAHVDSTGALCVTVRRYFDTPGGELAWYSEEYQEVSPCK